MQKNRLFFISLVLINLIFCSCKKEKINLSDCNAACKSVRLSGTVLDVSSNVGIANTAVKAHFYQWKSTCFICFGEPVETFAKTITDNSGRFNFEIIVDTGVFNYTGHYDLDVYANTGENYISGNPISFSNYKEHFTNITLTKYQKTKLSIRYKRDSLDLFEHYTADHTFSDNFNNLNIRPTNQLDYIKYFSQIISDTTIVVNTGANIWTKINGKKFLASSHIISSHIDSVFCSPNVLNNITIKY